MALTDPLYHHLAATGANCSDDKYLAPRHCYVGQYSTVQYSTVQGQPVGSALKTCLRLFSLKSREVGYESLGRSSRNARMYNN